MPSAALDRAEMGHLCDAVGECIAAYPPAGLKASKQASTTHAFAQWTGPSFYHPTPTLIPAALALTSISPQFPEQIADLILRAWPFGQSTREMGFLHLLGGVLASAPLLHHVDPATRVAQRAFARVAACLRSPHAGLAEDALLTCSNPRLIARYIGVGAPGAGPSGTEIPAMVRAALFQSAQGHWNADVREEAGRLLEWLVIGQTDLIVNCSCT